MGENVSCYNPFGSELVPSMEIAWGDWVVQSAKHPTLDFGSGSYALMCSNNESLTYKAGNNHSAKQ